MPFGTLMREAATAVRRRPLLILVQLAGNAILFALFYAWLSLPDRNLADLVLSAAGLLLIAAGLLWLHGFALAAFDPGESHPPRTVLRRLRRLAPWVVLITVVLALASWLGAAYHFVIWHVGLFAVLALVPFVSRIACGEPARGAVGILSSWMYWCAAVWLLVQGYYVPRILVWWAPAAESMTVETISMVIRFGIAYLLAVISWLMLAAVIGKLGEHRVADLAGEPAL